MLTKQTTLTISADLVAAFAEWSRDVNPLHVDPAAAAKTFFGRTIVHGALGALHALDRCPLFSSSSLDGNGGDAASGWEVDIEFRGAVYPEAEYAVSWEIADSGEARCVMSNSAGEPVTLIRLRDGAFADAAGATPTAERSPRPRPADRRLEELTPGLSVEGIYPVDRPTPHPGPLGSVPQSLVSVLGLSSYIVGMEIPGLRSLFTRLKLRVRNAAEFDSTTPLRYRVRLTRRDETFRMLETELEAFSPEGTLLAGGTLRSYVRFTPAATDFYRLRLPRRDANHLQDKVALVIGGSRGLGADIAAALALNGCKHVYATYRSSSVDEITQHFSQIRTLVTFVYADAADTRSCQELAERIAEAHGGLDLLVLNACQPPDRSSDYVERNTRLFEVPLTVFQRPLEQSSGTVIAISSSFVEEKPTGFERYIALKTRLESRVQAVCEKSTAIRAVIVRPPRLATSWNDTPAAAATVIPPAHVARTLVSDLMEPSEPLRLIDSFPKGIDDDIAETKGPVQRFHIVAGFTAEPLLPALEFWAEQLRLDAEFTFAGYGQVLQELLDPTSRLNAGDRGTNFLFIRVGDWLREVPREVLRSADRLAGYLRETADEFVSAVRTHRASAQTNTVLILCPSSEFPEIDPGVIESTESSVRAAVRELPGLQVVSAADYHDLYQVPPDAVLDPLRDKIGHIPFTPEYYCLLGTIAMRLAFRQWTPPKKLVAVDCDNTLWDGVVGEVGPGGVRIAPQHRRLQEKLVEIVEAGVLVALCSKNEPADVWSVFDSRDDMILKRDHLVAAMVNWQPKSRNLRELADKLNLGSDSFVFLDDNPVECAEVRSACPEVLTIQWPQDGAQASRLIDHCWELDRVDTTREDRKRTEMYQQEFRRQELKAQTKSFQKFLDSLKLEVDIRALDDADLGRASQLTRRTNQFNFTTRRRSEAELKALAEAPDHDAWTVRVRDRFGDYGIVGLLIAKRLPGKLEVDTFLLSCRTLGRGVEHRMVAWLGEVAREQDIEAVRLPIRFTDRNTPAREFLRSLASEGNLSESESSLTLEMTAADAAGVVFRPVEATHGDRADSGAAPAEPARRPDSTEWTRRREEQIETDASRPATLRELARRILRDRGEERMPRPVEEERGSERERGDLEALRRFVADVFRQELGLAETELKPDADLDSLGIDSFKIVEITVAIISKYPSVPTTLLFEHRSIDEIARAIARHEGFEVEKERSDRNHASPKTDRRPTRDRRVQSQIAVVGMGVRCAGAASLGEFWELLSRGRSAIRKVPDRRRGFLGELADDRSHWAGLIDDLDTFDAGFFGISPREAAFLDPQLRIVLQTAWHALEDAGWTDQGHPDFGRTGVFIGVMYGDYVHRANILAQRTGSLYRCWEGFSLANRLSQLMGFHGPSLAVDTACSSSGTAVHLACRAIANGECRAAVVGGVNLIIDPDRLAALGRLGILSQTGDCRPFGEGADGTVIGEGAGVIVLKPLAAAVADGDRVYGVIRGTGVSHGTGTVGFTAPNPQAQAEAIRRAVEDAGIDPRTISYVETHGTGTSLGDPIEIRGLELSYLDRTLWNESISLTQRCTIGAIKPNVGHLEAGAGIIGLIKVLLQLRHRKIVPTRTSPSPNPAIPFHRLPFEVGRKLTDWVAPEGNRAGKKTVFPLRAGVSSFGVGGANAHIVVEEAPSANLPQPDVSSASGRRERPVHVLALSAPDSSGLVRLAGSLRSQLESDGESSIASFCFSYNSTRRHFDVRSPVAAENREGLIRELERVVENVRSHGVRSPAGDLGKTAFLFTGQGAQFAGMGRRLYETHPLVQATLDDCDRIASEWLERPLLEVMFADDGTDDARLLHHTSYTQPALFALEVAIARLWRSWGIEPDYVIGHSIGEIAAYCFAGGLSLEDGMRLVAARGSLMGALPPGGGMAAVQCDEDEARRVIEAADGNVAIAAVNSPGQTVLSGANAALDTVLSRFEANGTRVTRLTVSHAFHSSLMDPMLDEFLAVAGQCHFEAPSIPVISTRTGSTDADFGRPEYWVDQIRHPVRFLSASQTALQSGATTFVEVGPQPALLGMLRRTAARMEDGTDLLALPSMRKDQAPWKVLSDSLCQWYRHGGRVDWKAWDECYERSRDDRIPLYPFAQDRHWIDESALEDVTAPSGKASGRTLAADQKDPRDWLYEVRWIKRDAESCSIDGATRRSWLILADSLGYGDAIARECSRRGDRCVTVRRDRSSSDREADETASVRSYHDLVKRIAALSDSDEIVIVNAWAIETIGSDEPRAAFEDSVVSAIHALQAAQMSDGPPFRCSLLTAGMAPVDSDCDDEFARGAMTSLLGLARTAALECPDEWGGLVDVSFDKSDFMEHVGNVVDALAGRSGDDVAALRGARRWVPRLVPSTPQTQRSFTCNPEGVYLVTGGTGALGLHVAQWLVAEGARHLVLCSRRGVVPKDGEPVIESLRANGAAVDVVSCDVADRGSVDRLFETIDRLGKPLSGVVHAAGLDQLKPLKSLSRSEIVDLLAPKAIGAAHLLDKVKDADVELFVLFSSVAATLGAAGRAHYAAANAFLDGLAVAAQRRMAGRVVSVAWGPWRGGGMADSTTLGLFERVGNYGLHPENALAALSYAVRRGASNVSVADIEWGRFRVAYEARRKRPLIESVGRRNGGVRTEAESAPDSWRRTLESCDESARAERVAGLLRQAVAEILGFASPDDVPTNRHFSELGMDSLMAVELAMRIRRRLGVAGLAIFDHPTIDQLSRAVLEQIDVAGPASASSDSAEVPPVPSGKDDVMRLIRAEAAQTLGHADAERVATDKSLLNMGMDSLMVVDFSVRLKRRLGRGSPADVFDCQTIEKLAERLASEAVPADVPGVASAPSSQLELVQYTAGLEPKIVEFARKAWPHRSPEWIAPRWKWMFVDSAVRCGVDPQVWLYQQGDRVVAHMGAIPVTLQIGERRTTVPWLVDTMVLEECRERALGSELMIRAKDDCPFSLSLGQTAYVRKILERLDWRQVAPLKTFCYVIRPGKIAAGKVGIPGLRQGAAAALFAKQLWKNKSRLRGENEQTISAIPVFTEEHGELWDRVSSHYRCAVVRDESFLNWKYVEQPGQQFTRLELRRDGRVVGIVVVMTTPADGVYPYSRGFVVDMIVDPTDSKAVSGLCRGALDALRRRGADLAVFYLINHALEAQIRRFGFWEREPTRYLWFLGDSLDQTTAESLAAPENWLVTMGDSDIDRPE